MLVDITEGSELVILIVDDEQDIAEELADLIESTGREVIYATSALVGLDMAKSQKVDLVITDMRMPEMDGAELVRKIADAYGHDHAPAFMVISGHLDVSDDLSHLHDISYSLIPKPVDVEVLLSQIAMMELNRSL